MKCPVCEALLVNGECAECQALSEALGALREEQLPSLMVKIPRRGRVVYPWVAAAAAAAILMLALPHLRRAEPASLRYGSYRAVSRRSECPRRRSR